MLLSKDVVEKPLMFGEGGILDPKQLLDPAKFGSQLNIIEDSFH